MTDTQVQTATQFTTTQAGIWSSVAPAPSAPLTLILPDDRRTDLGRLTTTRSAAVLPFAGRYALIDWALSYCVSSGIETMGVIEPDHSSRLRPYLDHSRIGDLDRHAELTLLSAHPESAGDPIGTASAVHQQQEFVLQHRAHDVLTMLGTPILNVDLATLTAQHHSVAADVTIVVAPGGMHDNGRSSTLQVDREGRVRKLIPPGTGVPGPLVLVGMLLFSGDTLSVRLNEDAGQVDSAHDLVLDVVARMLAAGDRVVALEHRGYWSSLLTVRDYWQAHMDLVSCDPGSKMQDLAWPIHTQPEFRPPTQIAQGAVIAHSLVCEGCTIYGTVEHSVLSPGVYVAPGAVVRNAVVMHDAVIGERATVENAILDRCSVAGTHAHVGQILRHAPTMQTSREDEIAIVTQDDHILEEGMINVSPKPVAAALSVKTTLS